MSGEQPGVEVAQEREYPGEYVCSVCDDVWVVDNYRVGGALDAARAHVEDCTPDAEVRYDPGLSAEDYDVDFEEVVE